MADLGMGGGQISQSMQTEKLKEAEKLDKKQAVRDREGMAGAQQTEAKHKKEDVEKTKGMFKAYKSAYEYLLGDEPEEEEIDEDMGSAPLEEEKEVEQPKAKPTLEEIERYNARGRFKAKVSLLLGDDFD